MIYEKKFSVYNEKEKQLFFDMLIAEADTIRETDKVLISNLFKKFYNKKLNVGIGFQRAYGAILSGDFFDLIKLPDGNFLFVFADISGHGLPAYTSLIRLRSAITICLKELERVYKKTNVIDTDIFVKDIIIRFTDVMEEANTDDFACVNFTFIYNEEDKFHLKFYNRSMLFPIVMRKFNNNLIDIFNLNNQEKGWIPNKGHLLGKDLKALLDDNYFETPVCEFTIYEGDSILFYSDGIIEASNKSNHMDEFDHRRVEEILLKCHEMPPQLLINYLFDQVYDFIGHSSKQKDDMTAVLIDFPPVRFNT